MKYLQLSSFAVVNSALNFDTSDAHVAGGCDLYTTKAAGSDKKLYKSIERALASQYGPTKTEQQTPLVPDHRGHYSRAEPFGSFDYRSNRRTYMYLIATLNVSHPDYDFSHVLRPEEFEREPNWRHVMNEVDSTIHSIRPKSTFLDIEPAHRCWNSPGSGASLGKGLSTAPAWGPDMWEIIDAEMSLDDCIAFNYAPRDDPFDEHRCIWRQHFFLYNKAKKRVCYIYLRGFSVTSQGSPWQRQHRGMPSGRPGMYDDDDEDRHGHKRAGYWLGDKFGGHVDLDGDETAFDDDDGFIWNRDADGKLCDDYDESGDCGVGDVDDGDDLSSDWIEDEDDDKEMHHPTWKTGNGDKARVDRLPIFRASESMDIDD